MVRTKITFLYSEVAGYFLACANELSRVADVLVVRWPVNKEAPFQLEVDERVRIVDKSNYSEKELFELVKDFNPEIVVCSGWMDKQYLEITKKLDNSIVKVLSLDNHWVGNVKQQVARLISPVYLKRIFSHAWVPGLKQEIFAKKLGFRNNIVKGFYCADTRLFKAKYNQSIEKKSELFPKRFLYVARYVKHKGIFEMWEAFNELQKEMPNEWELWCLGTGDEWDNRVEGNKIKHFGFVQPKDMDEFVEHTGVYILPSVFEPWGVSVQEFAIAGFPMILSDAIGSKEAFLKDNGYTFEAGKKEELKSAMKKMILATDLELKAMAFKSHQIGMEYTTEMWVERLMSLKK